MTFRKLWQLWCNFPISQMRSKIHSQESEFIWNHRFRLSWSAAKQPNHLSFQQTSPASQHWLNVSTINEIISSFYHHRVAKTTSAQWAVHHALGAQTVCRERRFSAEPHWDKEGLSAFNYSSHPFVIQYHCSLSRKWFQAADWTDLSLKKGLMAAFALECLLYPHDFLAAAVPEFDFIFISSACSQLSLSAEYTF